MCHLYFFRTLYMQYAVLNWLELGHLYFKIFLVYIILPLIDNPFWIWHVGNPFWACSENRGPAQQVTNTSQQDQWTSQRACKGTSTEEGDWTSAEERTAQDIQEVAGGNANGCRDCDCTNRAKEWRLTSCRTCRCIGYVPRWCTAYVPEWCTVTSLLVCK